MPSRSKPPTPATPRLSVRLARPDELDRVWELDRRNIKENWDLSPLTQAPLTRAELVRRHHQILARWWDPLHHIILIAVRGDEILGHCWYTVEPDPLFGEVVGFLFSIVVHPDSRRKGIGQRLLSEFMRRSRRKGARFARLAVLHHNWSAMNLYRQAGFVDETHYMLARLEPSKPEKAKTEAAERKRRQQKA